MKENRVLNIKRVKEDCKYLFWIALVFSLIAFYIPYLHIGGGDYTGDLPFWLFSFITNNTISFILLSFSLICGLIYLMLGVILYFIKQNYKNS